MILRRFMKHVSEQNWFAVGLDVCVVIVGIYIGIFLGELQADRQAAEETRKVLILLRDELGSDLTRLDEVVAFQRYKNGKTHEAMSLLIAAKEAGPMLREAMTIASGDNYTFFPSRSAYETLKSTGYLATHPDVALRKQILLLFERTYARQDLNAELYDNVIYDVMNGTFTPHWDMLEGQLYEGNPAAASIVRNGLWVIARQGDFYQEFLAKEVRSRMEKTISKINDVVQDGSKQGALQ